MGRRALGTWTVMWWENVKPHVAIMLIMVGACTLVLGYFAQSQSFQAFQIRNIEYLGVPDSAQGGSSRTTGPIPVKNIKNDVELSALDISFEFSTQEPTFSYGNLFQTGDSLDAIRMELQPSSNLVLVLGDGKLFLLSKSIQVGKYHSVHLKYKRNELFRVFVDNAETLNISDKGILAGRYDISNIAVGTGLAKQRTLFGTVKNFNLDGAYSYYDRVAKLSRWALIFLWGIVFLGSLPNKVIVGVMSDRAGALAVDLVDIIAVYGLSLTFIAMALFSIHFLGGRHLGLSKWFPHFMLPVSLIATLLAFRRQRNVWEWVRWPLSMIFLAYAATVAGSIEFKAHVYDTFILGVLLLSLPTFGLSFARAELGLSLSQGGGMRLASGVAIGISCLFLALSWSTLVDLTNWNEFRLSLDNNFGFVVVGAFLILRILLTVLFEPENSADMAVQSLYARGKLRDFVFHLSVDVAVIAAFLWISFRHDSLFIPGSEYHWEYYVGVIQGIRNGGWLLWDTPSQYGFLNVLLASLIPSASAWQAFYIFQGTLLFLVSTGIYFAARRYTSASVFHRVAVFAIVFMALFFADPELIGPNPFPSSSVVRFFWVYALVLVAWFVPKFGLPQAIALSVVWSFAIIWSAESAIYGTAIFLFIFAALLQTRVSENHRFALAGKYVVIAAMSLAMILTIIFTFYFTKLGVAPDLLCFFEHAVGYAKGYGYIPFPLTGPGNLLLLVFMGISILCIEAIQRGMDANESLVAPLAAMAGCIWGVSTYYIGRPVPQNITAMLPLIAMVVYFTLVLSKRMSQGAYSLPIKAVALPLMFFILTPVFNLKWIGNLAQVKSFASDVTTGLPKGTNELQQLLSRAEPSADTPIVYYGDEAAPPILSGDYAKLNNYNWLPIPLQLLEPPISETRRSLYIARYLCRNQPKEGILVHRNGDVTVRLPGFLHELHQFYDIEEITLDDVYTIHRFSRMNSRPCLSAVSKKTS